VAVRGRCSLESERRGIAGKFGKLRTGLTHYWPEKGSH
jgi:hypothetical protein